jgi:exodeoxyribonuclease VII large subunit
VQLFGEVFGLRAGRARVWFELRDADGAVPCAMWRDAFDELELPAGALADGAQVVVAGGPDYYPGSRTASPSFSFGVSGLRLAGEGDLLAQLEVLRKTLAAEGLFEPQKRLVRPGLPRCIGVVTGEGGKARDDVLAGLRRRGWAGRVVWAFAPVQDRHAAPAITRALQDLAALGEVEVVVVARGGGSLADLFAFCDETLCRTVALLRVPVIASVGHHADRTLIDDVAAVSCSTPTHAAESAVPLHCAEARAAVQGAAGRLAVHARRAVLDRARHLAHLSRAPGEHVARERRALHQKLREVRASATRRGRVERSATIARSRALGRRAAAAAGPELAARRTGLDGFTLALAAHDPERVVERGYAVVDDRHGHVVTSAEAAREARAVRLYFADAAVDATIEDASDG